MEETCSVIKKTACNWQTMALIGCVAILLLAMFYYLYKFMKHSNARFKLLEQAIGSLEERTKKNAFLPPHPQSPPQSSPQNFFTQPVVIPSAPIPSPSVVVVDTKTLDKELSEELRELSEGRVDHPPIVSPPPPSTSHTTSTSTTSTTTSTNDTPS